MTNWEKRLFIALEVNDTFPYYLRINQSGPRIVIYRVDGTILLLNDCA